MKICAANDLVATVAHAFRTPLTSLRMAVHILNEQTVRPLMIEIFQAP